MSKENLLPHQQRVVDERDALIEKLTALEEFVFWNKFFHDLGEFEKHLLMAQVHVMSQYKNLLESRLRLWGVM